MIPTLTTDQHTSGYAYTIASDIETEDAEKRKRERFTRWVDNILLPEPSLSLSFLDHPDLDLSEEMDKVFEKTLLGGARRLCCGEILQAHCMANTYSTWVF